MEPAVFGPDGGLEALARICDLAGCSMVDAALGWLLSRPGVASVIVGASTPEQMTRNAKLPQIAPSVVDECTEATEAVKQLNEDLGNWVDQYARESRVNGT